MFTTKKSPSQEYAFAAKQIQELEKTLQEWFIYELEDVDVMETRLKEYKNYIKEQDEILLAYE